MEKKKTYFGLNTVRKKVLMLSKLVGGVIVLFYLAVPELPGSPGTAFWIWFGMMAAVILGVDYLLGRMISKPLQEINDTAARMAKLDEEAYCRVNTGDEFGELSRNLNVMFSSLQKALGELESANEKLEEDVERERMLLAQRKELADSLSHEMKTPLGIICAYGEGLKEETDEEKRQMYTEGILKAAERMNRLAISLLDLSALEAGAARLAEEQFDFIELVETAAGRLLLDTPDGDFSFTYDIPETKVMVTADRRRMEQVLENLIENAKIHVCKGGKIHLEVLLREKELRFSIYNQGDAVPKEDLSKIWEKFYRGKDAPGGGSGLGLAIVSQILKLYKVPYGAENKNQGVEFHFYFPLQEMITKEEQ